MLVCNVSLRPLRSAIAADLAEIATAVDATATGYIVFATLVDDPASVGDIVDAYLGEIMLEAASAAAIVDGSIPAVYSAAIVEAATAADSPDGSAAVAYATLDGTATNATLSGGNLTATHSNTTTNSGAVSTTSKTTGKFYFEATFNTTPSNGDCVGLMQVGATFSNPVSAGTLSSNAYGTGVCYSDGGSQGNLLGAFSAGDVLSVAVDFTVYGTVGHIYFRRNGGPWNGSGLNGNPAANTGWLPMATPGVGYLPFVGFTTGGSGNNVTMNLGASAFAYAVPSGFTPGWPI